MDFVSLRNESNKCSINVLNSGRLDSVELGNVSMKESTVCDDIVGNSESNLVCSSNNHPDNKLSDLMNVNDINSSDLPNLDGDLKLSGNAGVRIGKVEKVDDVSFPVLANLNDNDVPNLDEGLKLSGNAGVQIGKVEKSDDVFSQEHKSLADIEAFENGIDLFVEVFGPLNEISEGTSKQCLNFKNEGEQECTFDVGDLVWVKTRTPLWWPGMIYDPSNAPTDETKAEKRGAFLVKYFGNENLIWCNNSDLKPFIEYFEQLSRQSTSRSFCGAVERAFFEIGQHVKSKMTCPCFSNENSNSKEKGKINFEPVSFLACVKKFAGSAYAPNKIEVTDTKNRLSSFYRSVGHLELPLQKLCARDGSISEIKEEGCNNIFYTGREKSARAKKKRNTSDYNDLTLSGKGSESRDNKNKDQEKENINKGKGSKKKWSAKFVKDRRVISEADNINVSSSELLDELRLVACEHFYLGESKFPDSLRRFYTSFRLYAFLDADMADEEAGPQPTPKKCPSKIKRKKKESENPSTNLESVDGKKTLKQPKGKKKEELAMPANIELGIGTNVDSSRMINFGMNCNPNPGLIPQVQIPGLPDLNKNNIPVPAEKISSPVAGPTQNVQLFDNSIINDASRCPNGQLTMNRQAAPTTPLVINTVRASFTTPQQAPQMDGLFPNNTGQNNIPVPAEKISSPFAWPAQNVQMFDNGIINDASQCPNGQFAMNRQAAPTAPLVINIGRASFTTPQQAPQMDGLFPNNTGPPTMKMHEINSQLDSFIPDLNGTEPDPTPTPDSRKRGSKEVTDPGGSLSLHFAPGSALPTMETLVKTFARYGLVNPFGIQFLSEWSIQIPYDRIADVRFAHRSLEKHNPFGEALVSFDLHCVEEKKKKKIKMQQPPVVTISAEAFRAPAPRPENPDVAVMKKNVEKMKQTLEMMGDKVKPEMRAMLEREIGAFLEKIGSLSGSSSSS